MENSSIAAARSPTTAIPGSVDCSATPGVPFFNHCAESGVLYTDLLQTMALFLLFGLY